MRALSLADVERALLSFDKDVPATEIQKACGHDADTTRRALVKLRDFGKAIQTGRFLWRHASIPVEISCEVPARCPHDNEVKPGVELACGCLFTPTQPSRAPLSVSPSKLVPAIPEYPGGTGIFIFSNEPKQFQSKLHDPPCKKHGIPGFCLKCAKDEVR